MVQDEQQMIAFIACAGHAAGKGRNYNAPSCKEAVERGFKPGECKTGCVGAGSCVVACPKGAIACEYGKVTIDREKCDGCGDCLSVCPQHLISLIPADATNFIPCSSTMGEDETLATCGYGCIGCKECENNCPVGAVKVIDNHAVIDYSKCVGCVTCTVVCKKKIIVDTKHDLTKVKSEVAFVRCSGGRAKEAYKAKKISTCKDAAALPASQKDGICLYGCSGLGDCVNVCRYDAIHVVDGVAVVDPEKCVGCGDCVRACPNSLIKLSAYRGARIVACSSHSTEAERRAVCDSACIGCGDCADNCPNGAITMDNGLAVSDPTKCENCKACSELCTRSCIHEQKVPEEIYLQQKALYETGREAAVCEH